MAKIPFKDLAMTQDVPEFLAAHDKVLEYDFDTYVGGSDLFTYDHCCKISESQRID